MHPKEAIQSVRNALPTLPLVTLPPVYIPPAIPDDPDKTPILFIFPKSKQLVTSLDAECVKVQALLVFSNYRHVTRECHEPDMSPNGKLPFLINSEGKALAGEEIVLEVTAKMGELESRLTPVQKADVLAFTALAEAKLHLALIYTLWYDNQNFHSITAPMYEKLYPWPLNFVLTRTMRMSHRNWLLQRKAVLKKDEILEDAQSTLAALSTQLGGQLYFFGSKASHLDAVVFGYLHIILSVLGSSSAEGSLRKAVLKHENLVQYARRVFNTYFAL
ncbi:Metaxin-2 [Borealophlyctis nickersoniae]|nr:Metaxin-2 [Borealophlyctis nickersoniae]